MFRTLQLRPFRRLSSVLAVASLGAVAFPLLTADGSSAAPTSIAGMRAEVQQIADQEATIRTKIEILSEEYDQAAARASRLSVAKRADETAYAGAQSKVAKDIANLHQQAVNAYVDAGATAGLTSAFSANASSLPVRQTYEAAAASDLSTAISTLHNSEITLSARRATLSTAETQATANANALATSRSSTTALELQLAQREAGVKGSLAAAVEQAAAAAEARAQAAAAAAASSAAQASVAAGGPVGGAVTSIGPASSTGGSGGSAVSAAETQLGVPYRWAGATPGSGFDCSGLTMWAWGRAGVNLPHSAEAQYQSIEHVSSSELQPGDLIFYASGGYIYHVVMYIGGGRMVQAEDTGTEIHTGPVPGGAYAYGRP